MGGDQRVGLPLRAPDDVAERGPVVVLIHAQVDVAAVLGPVRVHQRRAAAARRTTHLVVAQQGRGRDRRLHRPHAAAQQRRVDYAALAGPLSAEQGGDGARCEGEAGLAVAEGGCRHGGRKLVIGRGERRCQSGPGPERGRVVAAELGQGSPGSPTGVARVDDVGPSRPDVVHVDAQSLAHAGQEAGEEDIALLHQLEERFSTALVLQVDCDRALAAVEGVVEMARASLGRGHSPDRAAAHDLAVLGVFDLDHVGAPVRQDASRDRDGAVRRHVQDAISLE